MKLSIVGLSALGLGAGLLAGCGRPAYVPSAGGAFTTPAYPAASQLTVLHIFHDPSRGLNPIAPVVADSSGNLFGETFDGGIPNSGGGCGTVFELKASASGYTDKTLHRFQGSAIDYRNGDGCLPLGGLTIDAHGTIYGTAWFGGLGYASGVDFTLTPAKSGYAYKIIYFFKDGRDGAEPVGPLLVEPNGTIYGATQYGAAYACPGNTEGCGTVYRLTPHGSDYEEKILHVFHGGKDGLLPGAGLTMDSSGALYGTTTWGGGFGSIGNGTVYKLTPTANGYKERVIHAFAGSSDGSYPNAPVIVESNGDVDGTTVYGGSDDKDCNAESYGRICGLVFRLTPSGAKYKESFLYEFQGGSDGSEPEAPLLDAGGTLYGTTSDAAGGGGEFPCHHGCGTVFALHPSGRHYAHEVLYHLNNNVGTYPRAGLILYNGALYGTTYYQGRRHYAGGTVFQITP